MNVILARSLFQPLSAKFCDVAKPLGMAGKDKNPRIYAFPLLLSLLCIFIEYTLAACLNYPGTPRSFTEGESVRSSNSNANTILD